MKKVYLKAASNGEKLLNLACGSHMNSQWNNIDFSPYSRLAHHMTLAKGLVKIGLLSKKRYRVLQCVDTDIIYHDLRKGIPFHDNSFDVAYHSHFLEHIPRRAALPFLKDCYRILRPGGILRIVIPDLYLIIKRYNNAIAGLIQGKDDCWTLYDKAIYQLFDQFIPQEARGTKEQRWILRKIERLIRGNTCKIGQIHQWMYDRFSLKRILEHAGFGDIRMESADNSRIADWKDYFLDTRKDGSLYNPNPGSLYMEGMKPI